MISVLAFDPSGNWKEGKGTTGWANGIASVSTPWNVGEIKASDFKSPEAYWEAHLDLIFKQEPNEVVIEGYRLYNHAGQEAQKQSYSDLETSQLIGIIKMYCWERNIPCTVQYAKDVKSRWSDKILQAKEILEPGNKFDGQQTNPHKRDAIRHWMHYITFTREKRGK